MFLPTEFHFTATKVLTADLSLWHLLKNLLKYVIEFVHCDKSIVHGESDIVGAVVHWLCPNTRVTYRGGTLEFPPPPTSQNPA